MGSKPCPLGFKDNKLELAVGQADFNRRLAMIRLPVRSQLNAGMLRISIPLGRRGCQCLFNLTKRHPCSRQVKFFQGRLFKVCNV